MLHDEQRLKSEREKAHKNAKKFIQGMGSDTHGFGGYSGSYDYGKIFFFQNQRFFNNEQSL